MTWICDDCRKCTCEEISYLTPDAKAWVENLLAGNPPEEK